MILGPARRSTSSLWFALALTLGVACKRDDGASSGAHALKRDAVEPAFAVDAVLAERSGRGRIRYLGLDVSSTSPKRGDVIEVTHYFQVERPATGDYDVFVHGEVVGSGERVLVADHAPAHGKVPIPKWQKGEIWADPHRVKVPDDAPGQRIDLLVGLFKGNQRWTVEASRAIHDGRDRIRAARLTLSGAAPGDDLPEVTIPRAEGPIVADGKRDEATWAKAPVLRFADSMGRGTQVRFPTTLRLLYDDEFLYVFFESTDEDITERFSKRDDPIYDHETVELFMMPNVAAPELGPYIELQASPGGVIFDASFDGRRRGMNTKFDAGQTIGTVIDGTLNDPSPDKRWFSEWKVPFKKLRGVSAAPKPGDEWRMNAFRIEKFNQGGKLVGEYTAWSPPKVGDFHNVARFGRMKFGGPTAP